MLVAYLTVDEVNKGLAMGLAKRGNETLVRCRSRVYALRGSLDALLYDRDSFPMTARNEDLTKFFSSLALYPVTVHSYNLEEGLVNRWRQKGVAFHRRLTKAIFLGLKRRSPEMERFVGPAPDNRKGWNSSAHTPKLMNIRGWDPPRARPARWYPPFSGIQTVQIWVLGRSLKRRCSRKAAFSATTGHGDGKVRPRLSRDVGREQGSDGRIRGDLNVL